MASSGRRRNPKARLKSSLPALVVVCIAILGGGLLILLDSVSPGRLDGEISRRIAAQCGPRPDCEVRLGDLIPGTWDTFYEFGPTVPQSELTRILRTPRIHVAHLQRVLVMLESGRVVHRQYAHTGLLQPMAGEVVFASPNPSPEVQWVAFAPGASFRVTSCPTKEGGSALGQHGGNYYLLTPAQLTIGPASCAPPRGHAA